VTVPGGMEAIALLEIQKPRLIILELQINGVGGMNLLKAIRADAGFGDVPAIVYTMEISDAARQQALAFKNGVALAAAKPICFRHLQLLGER